MREILTELILDFYERIIPELIQRNITVHELPRNASVVAGMRRTGKTFRVYQKIKELLSTGVELDKILYLNFDDDRLIGISIEDLRLIPEIFYQQYPNNREHLCYFFLDEIQEIDKWELFARRLIDTGNIQVYLTGSSSKLLSAEIATTMRGRSLETEVFPYSFEEFIRANEILDNIPKQISSSVKSKICNALDLYFQIGGFPDVQKRTPEIWVTLLQNYANEVLYRDVVERYNISNIQALKYILQKTFHNPGCKLSANAIYKELKGKGFKIDREAITEYIDCFCRAYLFYSVPFHSDSLAQKQVNPAKIYLVDVGMVRAMNSKKSADNGILLENLIFLHLRRKGYKIEYLVTRNGYEIDFIAYYPLEREYKIIQVSYTLKNEDTLEREIRALKDVIDYVHAQECLIVTWAEEAELEHGIKAIPAWKFLLDRY